MLISSKLVAGSPNFRNKSKSLLSCHICGSQELNAAGSTGAAGAAISNTSPFGIGGKPANARFSLIVMLASTLFATNGDNELMLSMTRCAASLTVCVLASIPNASRASSMLTTPA